METLRMLLLTVLAGAMLPSCAENRGGSPAATTGPTTRGVVSGVSDDWGILGVVRTKFPGVRQLSTTGLELELTGGKKVVLLDVRKREEFDVSHLPGAVHIPPGLSGEQMAAKLAALGVGKNDAIVAYCSVGYRSSSCAKKLNQVGFTDVANLEGSIFRWANEGRTVVKTVEGKEVQASEVHPFDPTWGKLLRSDMHPAGK